MTLVVEEYRKVHEVVSDVASKCLNKLVNMLAFLGINNIVQ
jgi:hypothetical protein